MVVPGIPKRQLGRVRHFFAKRYRNAVVRLSGNEALFLGGHMDNEDQVERWRRDLSGRDPIKFLNTMPAVGRSGLPEGVELLEKAGEFLPPSFWDQIIDLNYKKVTVREFRDEWLATLRASLPHAFRPG